jgi:hypothetical protein
MTTPREGHTTTLLPSGKVLVTGGTNATGPLASAELYDPLAGTWTATGSMSVARHHHTATLLPSGKVLVTGGYSVPFGPGQTSAELYDPDTGTWTPTGSMAQRRIEHIAALLPSGKVLVSGGYLDRGGEFIIATATAELFDPTTGTWSSTGGMLRFRSRHTVTVLHSGRLAGQVLVTGGWNDSDGDLRTAELYDPATRTWSATGDMTERRYGHTATQLHLGKVLVAGAYNGSAYLVTAELYDPETGTWSATGSMSTGRAGHTATLLESGKVLVAGGAGTGHGRLATAELYDPFTGIWNFTGNMSTARAGHTATLLPMPSNSVLVTGGESGPIHSSAERYLP